MERTLRDPLVALVALVCLVFYPVLGQEVIGCGGFVRSTKNIDVSRVQMTLLSNKNGNLRKVGSTDCAPINGYYFIPVYENGDYVLKANAPRGWKVEPSELALKINGETDPCSKNVDLNFEFIGFGITGSVLSEGSNSGPPGIDIELLGPDGKIVLQKATTNEEGHFVFFGVSPGSYVARVSSAHAKSYAFDSEQRTVEVGEDVGLCQPFKIKNYEVSGQILTSSGKPVANVLFEIRPAEGSDAGPMKVRSDAVGQFSARLPNGKYSIKADLENREVTLASAVQEAIVSHQNLKVAPFKIDSFVVRGKVHTSEKGGKPLARAKVALTHGGKTFNLLASEDGSFLIENVRQGPLSVKVSSDGYDFDTVTLPNVEPGDAFPTISPVRYLLSGKVERESLPVDTEVRVKFISAEDQKPHNGRVLATDKGTYSVYLPPGRYSVSVELSVEQANIGFAPLKHDITISDGPVHNINFQPVKANLEGRVSFLGSAQSTIDITLASAGGSLSSTLTASTDSKGHFKFEGILPGTYTMSVEDSDQRCWEEMIKHISVSEDVKDIVFKQTGYKVSVYSTRSAILVLSDDKGSALEEVVVGRGEDQICIKSQKPVKLFTKGCVEFDIEPDRIEDPSTIDSDLRITLKPTKFQVSGGITSKNPIPDLKLRATSDLRQVDVETTKSSTGYEFSFMAYPGEDLAFHPQSEEHLFDPESLHVLVDNDCHIESVQFEATTGFFLRGQITPAVEGVKIDLNDFVSKAVRTTVLTDAQGSYKVGPLPADSTYDVIAHKEGYIFEAVPNKQGHFTARKLASIVVRVMDGASGAVLPGVVVSISGGSDYRSNTVTKAGGEAQFLSLAPGRYFAKPQIKEYEFDPKHQILDLTEGQTGEITFKGKRVAFSIFGKIASLNGEPEAGVRLRAKGVAPQGCVGHSEEATSESSGEFRLRGLQPNCEYIVALQSEKRAIEKLIPEETRVLVVENDTDLATPIIAMRAFEFTDATIKILDDGTSTKPSLVKVTVTSDSGFTFTSQALVGQLVVLPRVAKDDKRYTVNVDTVSSDRFPAPKRATAYFRADEYFKIVEVTITRQAPTVNKTVRKISAFVYFLPALLAIIVTYIFWDKMPAGVHATVDKWINTGSNFSAQNSGSGQSEDVWDGTLAKKRTKKRT